MRAVVFTGAGGNEVVRVVERPDPEPVPGEVIVAVRYAGVNPADVAQRAGLYPAPPGSPADVPGLEVAGTVVAAGPGASRWRPGDRVFGIVGGGGLASRVAVHESHLVAVPALLGDREAAAVPEVFTTAHDAVVSQGGLRAGDVLVVNGANGGVGTAAVQIGVALGARVVGSARSTSSHGALAALGAEPVVPEAMAARARDLGGAAVVLELVGARNLSASLDSLATGGRIVVVGTGAGHTAELSLLRLMMKRARLIGTVLRARSLEEKAAVVAAFERDVVPHLADSRMRPLVDRVYTAADVAAAFDRLAAPGKLGKILLDFGA